MLGQATVEQLDKHARKHGPEGIVETAADCYRAGAFSYADVCAVIKNLDQLNVEKHGKWAKGHRLTIEERADRLLGIEPEEAA